jgi:ribosomal protein S18 acetylase RimI-like enzyme
VGAKVHLREAVPTDSEFIFDVRRAAFRHSVELAGGWDEAAELARHRERFARQRFRVVVAEGVDVGFTATTVLGAATAEPPSCHLHQLMLLPEHQSRGVGSTCLGILAAEARELELPLRLRVLRVNPKALAFFLAAGFEIVGESESHLALELDGSLAEGRSDARSRRGRPRSVGSA